MKHTKPHALFMAAVMLMGAMSVPASACTADPEGNVTPCEQVEEKGYCDSSLIFFYSNEEQTQLSFMNNPHHKRSAPPVGATTGNIKGMGLSAKDFLEEQARLNYDDIIDYDNWTVHYVDKNGQSTGYKCVINPDNFSRDFFHPDGTPFAMEEYKNPFAVIEGSKKDPAYASTQTVNVDGKAVTFACYALKDENGNATNYIKLRDLAILLNGSAAQFEVGWDGSVTITTQTAYTPNGSELSTPYAGDRAYQETTAETKVNGQAVGLSAFVLSDDNGGGYTYYQLRGLGRALGFNVGWSSDKGIFLETDKPYNAND